MIDTKIYFCKKNCCPFIEKDGENIKLGDPEGPEGVTTWSKDQFNDFVQAAKNGKFDSI